MVFIRVSRRLARPSAQGWQRNGSQRQPLGGMQRLGAAAKSSTCSRVAAPCADSIAASWRPARLTVELHQQ